MAATLVTQIGLPRSGMYRNILGALEIIGRKLGYGLDTAVSGASNLFFNAEQGVWYDPSDFSTLFQDSAGTTPVTAVEQPVGLMLDKHQSDNRGIVNFIRNNTMVGAVVGTPGTLPTNWTVPAAGMSTTIGLATENGIPCVDITLSGTANANNSRIYFDSVLPSASDGQVWTASCYLKLQAGTYTELVQLRVTDSGSTLDETGYTAPVGGTLLRHSRTRTLSGGFAFAQFAIRVALTIGASYNFTLRIGLPQLERGSTATAPQLNSGTVGGPGNHATQATSASRPILRQDANGKYYLFFDGIDDSLATAAINFTSTDKMTVFAGVRKLSDAASSYLLELSASVDVNNGSFYIRAPSGAVPTFNTASRGTGATAVTVSGYAAPVTAVLSGRYNISAPSCLLAVNGSASSTASSQGTGNYGNYPLNIGRRNNSYSPFNGHLYGLVVRGSASTDSQIVSAEAWMNQKTGAY